MSRFLKMLKNTVQQAPVIAKQVADSAVVAAQKTTHVASNSAQQVVNTASDSAKQAVKLANTSYKQVNTIVSSVRSTGRVIKWSVVLVSSGGFLYGVSKVLEAWPKNDKD